VSGKGTEAPFLIHLVPRYAKCSRKKKKDIADKNKPTCYPHWEAERFWHDSLHEVFPAAVSEIHTAPDHCVPLDGE
jgi:hypothetical protein